MTMLCTLPGGYFDDDGTLHRTAELQELSGRDEELLVGRSASSSATRVSEVLSRCVARIGWVEPVTTDVARELLVADRQFLLLKLREISIGSQIDGTVPCPWPDCGAKVDVDFSTTDVPVSAAEDRMPTHTIELPEDAWVDDGAPAPSHSVTFRLPNGADQEALEGIVAHNPAEALAALFDRCVVVVPAPDGASQRFEADRLSSRGRLVLERAMEERAPSVSLEMSMTCPGCGRGFAVPFNLQDFFFGELRTSRDLLRRQVHYLAFHYHWSEREILDLPREKRLSYISVLAEEIEALNDAV